MMTLAVMTRATLGHSGRLLTADRLTMLVYTLVFSGALIRVAAPYVDLPHYGLHLLAGVAWSAGFLLFSIGYGHYFLSPRVSSN